MHRSSEVGAARSAADMCSALPCFGRGVGADPISLGARFGGRRRNVSLDASSGFDPPLMIALTSSRLLERDAIVDGLPTIRSCRKELTKKASERLFDDHEVVLPGNLDGYEFRDAPGISQRVDDVLGGQFAHDQCQVAFEGGLDGASINPLHIFSSTSTTSHFHQKFCVFHNLLSCLEGSAEKESLHR
jgi:hypothetical protein